MFCPLFDSDILGKEISLSIMYQKNRHSIVTSKTCYVWNKNQGKIPYSITGFKYAKGKLLSVCCKKPAAMSSNVMNSVIFYLK